MRQITRYLYEYDGTKKVRNIGFVKASIEERAAVVQIYGRTRASGGRQNLEVYLFYEKDGRRIAVLQGALPETGSPMHYILKCTEEDIGGAERMEAIEGILLREENGKLYAALWEEAEFDPERLVFAPEEEGQTLTEEQGEETAQEAVQEMEYEETVEAESIEGAEEAAETEGFPRCRKIRRQDLICLARKEWRVANNSFLLHGYYNYHHLLLIEDEDGTYLGVPGIFHEREQRAAAAFGFGRFYRPSDAEVELGEEEKNANDDFGYWYRPVQKGRDTDESRREIYERGDEAGEESVRHRGSAYRLCDRP